MGKKLCYWVYREYNFCPLTQKPPLVPKKKLNIYTSKENGGSNHRTKFELDNKKKWNQHIL